MWEKRFAFTIFPIAPVQIGNSTSGSALKKDSPCKDLAGTPLEPRLICRVGLNANGDIDIPILAATEANRSEDATGCGLKPSNLQAMVAGNCNYLHNLRG